MESRIVVNGSLVTDIEEYREISQSSGHLDVVFVFVQAKRSASFEANTIGTFGFAVLDFFKEEPTLPRGGDVGKYAEIMEAIYEESAKFKNGSNPECHLYYVTTGKWSRDPALESRRTHVMNDLQCLAQFSAVEFHPVDAENIQILYQRTKSTASATFNFADCSVLPDMPGVTQAYIGFLPISEFFKLVMDDDDEIIRGLFYSNPRDWIGYNKINTEIKDTLESAARRARFALMNNGVTIIAGSSGLETSSISTITRLSTDARRPTHWQTIGHSSTIRLRFPFVSLARKTMMLRNR